MDEAQPGRVAGGDDRRVADAVQRACGGRKRTVDGVGAAPVAPVVESPLPGYAGRLAPPCVCGPDPESFAAAQLLEAEPGWQVLREAEAVHPVDHLEALGWVGCQVRLADEVSGGARLACRVGIQADAGLACPADQASVFRERAHRRVGDGGARPEQEEIE